MSWKMIGQPKVRKLTRSLAEEFAGLTPAPHDRPLNATRAAVLRAAFELGKFRTCEWATAYCEQTKQTYRVNGKHTSTTLAQFNGHFPDSLSVVVEHYHCDTLEDVASLYTTFDTKSSARSTGDINHVFAAACPELDDVSGKVINLTVTGIAYATWEDMAASQAAETRAKKILENSEFCLWLRDLFSTDHHRISFIMRSAVVAAMWKTWNKSKTSATEFWMAVRDETGTRPDMPDRKLAKTLLTSKLYMGNRRTGKTPMAPHEMYFRCLSAWNCWRQGGKEPLYKKGTKTPAVK